MKRFLPSVVLLSTVVLVPSTALASNTITGRVATVSPISLSVSDKEVVTLSLDSRTTYSKLITQKPWQADTRLSATALTIGRYVIVHRRGDDRSVADWVQIATDMPVVTAAAVPAAAFFTAQSGASSAAAPKAKASGLLTSTQVKDLIANAKTPADHLKLQKHYLALAAKHEAEAADHAADAQAYKKNPTFQESKNPAAAGTSGHCDRFADLERQAAKEARELAAAHEKMAR